MMRLTKKKAQDLLVDERKANKLYKKYGYKRMAKDEGRHAMFFDKMLKFVFNK